jgi:NADH-quinone oxidoreductase subunit E
MLRRLYPDQPESFAFTPDNLDWANSWIAKYPEGRQASAVIPLLWRAQEQEGWVTKPAIEYIANMLGMAEIRVLEVATFYFMFQLQPVGEVAHFQICGTTSCMICGAEDLISVCKKRIAPNPHELSADGRFSWEEVECLGACANAPMAQIGKDYYEDLTAEGFEALLDDFAAGGVPRPGSQIGRFSSEPFEGLSSLTEGDRVETANASVALALALGDTITRITGAPVPSRAMAPTSPGTRPASMEAPRVEGPDDLTVIKGIGPQLEAMLRGLGYYHLDQIAAWTDDEVAWVDQNLEGFHGRVIRDKWVEQARALVADAAPATHD